MINPLQEGIFTEELHKFEVMNVKKELYLASASPRRKDLLIGLGADITIIKTNAEEKIDINLPPHILVQELALLKGSAAASGLQDGLVISADTIVWFKNMPLGKPSGKEEAIDMLSSLSGNVHQVYTGVCVIDTSTGKCITDYEVTNVSFNTLSHDEIERYVDSGAPYDKAGGYGIQGKAALFVSKIDGDYFNVVGLPLTKLNNILKNEFEFNLI